MAATKMARSPSIGTSRPMTKTRGILLETMQLVEPKKHVPVPNHLLETKIYSKIASNDVVQARPAVLHFGGYELGQTQKLTLRLANVSTEVQRMHVIPPQTKYFYIRYTKNDRLVPGLTLDCTVEFTPDEWRYYYDSIRIHTKADEHLVIPIHAYPVMSTDDFPTNLDFPPVPIGHKMTKTIPLRCNVPIDFEFQLNLLQPHPAFNVDPMNGIVPANSDVQIAVTFAPSEFSTAHMVLQLLVSQFNAKPLNCAITGSSAPGLAKELTEVSHQQDCPDPSLLDPRCITPIDRIRQRRKKQTSKPPENPKATNERTRRRGIPDLTTTFVSKSQTFLAKKIAEVEQEGIKFPSNLDTPYSVAQVLLQEPGKLRMKDIREAVMAQKADGVESTRQMKEAVFEMAVRQDVYEERQNQLRWQSKVGEDPVSDDTRTAILDMRESALSTYQRQRGDPTIYEEYMRSKTRCSFRRTRRDVSELGEDGVKFDLYTNNTWAVRHSALNKLQQAARRTIIRRRADKKIRLLRETLLNKHKSRNSLQKEEDENEDLPEPVLQLDRVRSITFPTYAPPDVKDDMAVDALGIVPFIPTDVVVKEKVPYFDLKVPQHYTLQGYSAHSVHEASGNYVPPQLVRTLRTGAEDEVINLPPAVPVPAVIRESTVFDSTALPVVEADMKVEELVTPRLTDSTPCSMPLQPPPAMFQPIEYPPLHIFNPAPGLQVFQAPLPYAETDTDFHLCPLPRYVSQDLLNPHMSTQKKYTDRDDVIRGVMAWKRFPSQGLTSLSNTPTLSNVWVPRWNEAFNDDLLPSEVPELYNSLPEEDRDNLVQDEDADSNDQVALVPAMVNAQFPLISEVPPEPEKTTKKEEVFPHGNKLPATNIPVSAVGHVPRERREHELEYFLQKKYNKLGSKFISRVKTLDNLKTDPQLILK